MSNNIKIGVYVDMENIRRSGGHGIRYDVLRRFASREGGNVLRMNTYIAFDGYRASDDKEYAQKQRQYQQVLRNTGWKVVVKQVRKFTDEEGIETTKANADLDLAVDVLLQSENLDKIILVTGDGDFLKVVEALQNKGCRVELIALKNCSGELRCQVDNYYNGFAIPGLIPFEEGSPHSSDLDWGQLNSRVRGVVTTFNEKHKFGFIRYMKSISPNLWITDNRQDDSPYESAYFHISDFNGYVEPRVMKGPDVVVEFNVCENEEDKEGFAAKELELRTP